MTQTSENITKQVFNVTCIGDYITLMKPRVMSLAVFTGLVGMYAGTSFLSLHPVMAFAIILCIALGAGAAGALNMWYESELDSLMKRTRHRPLPAARMHTGEALGLGLFFAIASCLVLALFTNILAALLLCFTIFFYTVVYTIWLKRATPQNIVIGGVAGALPPIVGYAAVHGNIGVESLLMFAIIFFWTPPHFWALSLFCEADYRKAGIPMLTLTVGKKATKWQVCCYSALLGVFSVLPYSLGFVGLLYLVTAIVLSLGFMIMSVILYVNDEVENENSLAKKLFWFSIVHLFILFSLMLIN